MIVGYKNNEILKLNTEFINNVLSISLLRGNNIKLKAFVDTFNDTSFEEKLSDILNSDELPEESVLRGKFKDYLLNKNFTENISEDSFSFESEYLTSVRNYNGNSINTIDNLRFFFNIKLNEEVLNMLKDSIESINPIDVSTLSYPTDIPGITEYVVYMGPNDKYRGCLGKVFNTRDNDVASLLIRFQNKYKDSGNLAGFWSRPENLIYLKSEEV